jgi:hypothetical protein
LNSSWAKPIQKVRRFPPTPNAAFMAIESTTLLMKFCELA